MSSSSPQEPKRRRRRTETSAFGSPGRIGHDSTSFYGSRLYSDQLAEKNVPYHENPLPTDIVNRVFCKSSESMDELPDCSVHLMVTSPPYNVGKEYDQDLSLADYLSLLKRVMSEVYRVLVPGGRACINIANLGRRPYLPLHSYFIEVMRELGFLMRGEIIWNKSSSASPSTAWGSWMSAANPTLRDIHEYILVFSKDRFGRKTPENRFSTIVKDEFLQYTKSVWTFPAESARRVGHPAPFPVELPRRLLELYTYDNDVVLDPFMGSGSTGIAALRTGRRYIGYDISEEYSALSLQRIMQSGRESSGLNNIIVDLLNDQESVEHLQAGLPFAFEMAAAEAQRIQMRGNATHASTGQEVGIARERVILGYLRSRLGEMNVRLPQPGESMVDARVGGTPLEIKTVTGSGNVTFKWTVDSASVARTMEEFDFSADMWLVRIWWEEEKKSVFYIPMEVLSDKRLDIPAFWKSGTGTNNRGIKFDREFMLAAQSDPRTIAVNINWRRSGHRMPDPIARHVKYWTDGDFPDQENIQDLLLL